MVCRPYAGSSPLAPFTDEETDAFGGWVTVPRVGSRGAFVEGRFMRLQKGSHTWRGWGSGDESFHMSVSCPVLAPFRWPFW